MVTYVNVNLKMINWPIISEIKNDKQINELKKELDRYKINEKTKDDKMKTLYLKIKDYRLFKTII